MTYPHSTTNTSTITRPSITPSYGKISAISYSEAMDVANDGQRLADRNDTTDIMDQTLGGAQHDAPKVDEQVETNMKGEVTEAPGPLPVLERPREGNDGAQQSSIQMLSTAQTTPLPPLTQNLISLYGLQPLAATVARTDPVTGEKINKMRKSYENHLKTMPLAGRNKPVKHDESKGMGLLDLTRWPEEEWQNQKVHGKDVHKGLPPNIMDKLDKAMQMLPGPVPNNNEWEDLLGHDKPKPVDNNTKVPKPLNKNAKPNGQVNGTSTPTEANRPKRSAKKRRYDDQSFEGYGEGFVDDDVDLGGYSSGDTQFSRRSGSNKKRKKDYGNNPTGFGDRTGSFGTSMVGVSAYGR